MVFLSVWLGVVVWRKRSRLDEQRAKDRHQSVHTTTSDAAQGSSLGRRKSTRSMLLNITNTTFDPRAAQRGSAPSDPLAEEDEGPYYSGVDAGGGATNGPAEGGLYAAVDDDDDDDDDGNFCADGDAGELYAAAVPVATTAFGKFKSTTSVQSYLEPTGAEHAQYEYSAVGEGDQPEYAEPGELSKFSREESFRGFGPSDPQTLYAIPLETSFGFGDDFNEDAANTEGTYLAPVSGSNRHIEPGPSAGADAGAGTYAMPLAEDGVYHEATYDQPLANDGVYDAATAPESGANANANADGGIWLGPQYARGNALADGVYHAATASTVGANADGGIWLDPQYAQATGTASARGIYHQADDVPEGSYEELPAGVVHDTDRGGAELVLEASETAPDVIRYLVRTKGVNKGGGADYVVSCYVPKTGKYHHDKVATGAGGAWSCRGETAVDVTALAAAVADGFRATYRCASLAPVHAGEAIV